MQLEELCTFAWTYDRDRVPGFVLLKAFGEDGPGYGEGSGAVAGRIAGSSVWSNHPRRRGDGMMLPDVHGLISTDDGARIVFDLHGRSRFVGDGTRGEMTLVGSFTSDDERYTWLNEVLCIGEGVFHTRENRIDVRMYTGVPELD